MNHVCTGPPENIENITDLKKLNMQGPKVFVLMS